MLVIISDLHLGDGSCGKSISPGAFYLFVAKDPKQPKFVPYQMLSYLIFYRDDQRGGRHFEAWSVAFA